MVAANQMPWWKGARGEWFVVMQLVLIALVFFGPHTIFGQPGWRFPFPGACRIVGAVLMVIGGGLLMAGLVRLGRGLTPLPFPRKGAVLIETGPYAFVRHPMYSGGVVLALGWALLVHSWFTVGYVVILFVFVDIKSRREEKWLREKFPAYQSYQKRVRKLIPFVY